MPTVERIETWRGEDVLDGAGEKAGRLEEVYYDSTGQEPVLLLVKHGMLGHQEMLVPASEAVLCRDYLRVPFTAEQINQAQNASVEDELSSEQVAAIGALFKVTLPSSGPVYSSSLIERRRIEAEEAHRHAHELEVEAQHRAEELEEARKRAGAAAEEAHAAQRAREQADSAAFDANRQTPPSSELGDHLPSRPPGRPRSPRPAGAGQVLQSSEHARLVEAAVLDAFTTAKRCRRKANRPPGELALAAAARLRGHEQRVVVHLDQYRQIARVARG